MEQYHMLLQHSTGKEVTKPSACGPEAVVGGDDGNGDQRESNKKTTDY